MNERPLTEASRAAWRNAIRWFDPLHAAQLSVAAPPRSRSTAWIQSWLDATEWWGGAFARGPRAWPEANGRLLGDLAAGVSGAFRGRRMALEVRGRPLAGVLEWTSLEVREEGYGARLQFRDLDWDGLRLDRLSVAADAVGLTPPPSVALTASGIELEGLSRLEPLLAWLSPRFPSWLLRVDEDGAVEAIARRGARRLLIEPVIVDGTLEVELRGAKWRRAFVRFPSWLRLRRRVPLPTLAEGVTILEAARRGTIVHFRLELPEVRHRFDLAGLRAAISREAHLRST